MSIMNLKILNNNEKFIHISIRNNSIHSFSLFGKSNTYLINSIELLEKISPFDEFKAMKYNITEKKEIDNKYYKNFINQLDNKIKEKTFGNEYYITYKKIY